MKRKAETKWTQKPNWLGIRNGAWQWVKEHQRNIMTGVSDWILVGLFCLSVQPWLILEALKSKIVNRHIPFSKMVFVVCGAIALLCLSAVKRCEKLRERIKFPVTLKRVYVCLNIWKYDFVYVCIFICAWTKTRPSVKKCFVLMNGKEWDYSDVSTIQAPGILRAIRADPLIISMTLKRDTCSIEKQSCFTAWMGFCLFK